LGGAQGYLQKSMLSLKQEMKSLASLLSLYW